MSDIYLYEEGVASEAEADLEYAYAVGRDRPNCAWILSDRDVWHANPFYKGAPVRHPEDREPEDAYA